MERKLVVKRIVHMLCNLQNILYESLRLRVVNCLYCTVYKQLTTLILKDIHTKYSKLLNSHKYLLLNSLLYFIMHEMYLGYSKPYTLLGQSIRTSPNIDVLIVP